MRYPVEAKYSFHWQLKDRILRIDTAPHHRNLSTYPRHMHIGKEEHVAEDTVTKIDSTIEENMKCVPQFVRGKLDK
ncbi:MAG: DUF6516 family protein [Candidatus Methanoperedens sp.]|uniref:toxin-antitoxin system TumE family protein n=1 Tax=Candidatus Methanoperedens nitratireducens TaxID=1392998 RepID=UPI00240FFBAB|nr:DUF6516 family protein [Candidatus Methanoperedens nitroreducens]MDJ1421095.1 DUF6516 family protein [Candidatus Methanoperedens sp.]